MLVDERPVPSKAELNAARERDRREYGVEVEGTPGAAKLKEWIANGRITVPVSHNRHNATVTPWSLYHLPCTLYGRCVPSLSPRQPLSPL